MLNNIFSENDLIENIKTMKIQVNIMKTFQLLFTPLNLGNLVLKNRITLAPMFLCYGNADGTVSEKTIEFYARRAKAGVSLLVVEASAVDSKGMGLSRMIRADSDQYINGLSQLAKAIKDAGGYAVLQLYHGGRYSQQPIAPSPVETYLAPEKKIIPKAMSLVEITELITKFGEAAERAKMAGFDGVELHGASGYLLAQFISPISNKIEMEEVGLSAIFIEKNGSRIELMGYKGAIPKRSAGIEITMGGSSIPINDHITFTVDDLGATVTELKGKGIEFVLDPMQVEGGMKIATFKDPNGMLIELVEHPK